MDANHAAYPPGLVIMASAETVPTSRPSLGDKVQPDPIALFERHLKYLQDSYLNFFQERYVRLAWLYASFGDRCCFQSKDRGSIVSYDFLVACVLTYIEPSVESLLRLHKKTKTTDIYLDHATEPNTVRQVWAEVRDGLERGSLNPTFN